MTCSWALALLLPASLLAGSDWISIFDGKTLAGWQITGNAKWTIANGVLSGRQGPEFAGGDIYTNEEWKDFEAELEFRLNEPANSGLWFRKRDKQPGYQVDLLDEAAHPDILSGSVYADKRGFILKNADPRTYRKHAWNHLKVRVVGSRISVHLNGTLVAGLDDAAFPGPGSLGLQIHGGKWAPGMVAEFRKFRVRSLDQKRD